MDNYSVLFTCPEIVVSILKNFSSSEIDINKRVCKVWYNYAQKLLSLRFQVEFQLNRKRLKDIFTDTEIKSFAKRLHCEPFVVLSFVSLSTQRSEVAAEKINDYVNSLRLPQNAMHICISSYAGVIGSLLNENGQLVSSEIFNSRRPLRSTVLNVNIPRLFGQLQHQLFVKSFCFPAHYAADWHFDATSIYQFGELNAFSLNNDAIQAQRLCDQLNLPFDENAKCLLVWSGATPDDIDGGGSFEDITQLVIHLFRARYNNQLAVAGGVCDFIRTNNVSYQNGVAGHVMCGLLIGGHGVRAVSFVIDGTSEEKVKDQCRRARMRIDSLGNRKTIALMFSCCGRGKKYWRKENVESQILKSVFGEDLLVFGLFTMGEYGANFFGDRSEPAVDFHLMDGMQIYSFGFTTAVAIICID